MYYIHRNRIHENGGTKFLRNVSNCMPDNVVLPQWEPVSSLTDTCIMLKSRPREAPSSPSYTSSRRCALALRKLYRLCIQERRELCVKVWRENLSPERLYCATAVIKQGFPTVAGCQSWLGELPRAIPRCLYTLHSAVQQNYVLNAREMMLHWVVIYSFPVTTHPSTSQSVVTRSDNFLLYLPVRCRHLQSLTNINLPWTNTCESGITDTDTTDKIWLILRR